MNVDEKNWFVRKAMALVQHYDHEAYWRMRAEEVVSDVPAYATAVGVPARIILKEEKEKRAAT